MKNNSGPPRKELPDKKKAGMIEVLVRNDINYTNPSWSYNLYVGKINGKWTFWSPQYLL